VIRILLADDNPVIRSGLASLLESDERLEVVAQASTGAEAVRLAEQHDPDVVLLDVRMPVMNGVEAAAVVSRSTPVLMLTYSEEPDVVKSAIRAGASGYLVHGRFTREELVQAVVGVAEGQGALSPAVAPVVFEAVRSEPASSDRTVLADLTDREREIMTLLATGSSNAEIAQRLFLAEKTVKNHLNRIYAKLGVGTRGEAMARWMGTLPHQVATRNPPRP
jgi:DNA-binding NarL/FixJ family response regulator